MIMLYIMQHLPSTLPPHFRGSGTRIKLPVFFVFFSIIITIYMDSLVTNKLKIKVNKARQHRTQNLQKTYTAYCKFCTQIEHKNIKYIEKILNAKYLVREREREREKKNQEKNRGPLKRSVFLINFIVHFKISEFIWEVKSSAP